MNILIGLTAVIAGAIALSKAGNAIPEYNEASRGLEETKEFQFKVKTMLSGEPEQALINEATQIAQLRERVYSRMKNSAAIDLTLRVALIAGCGVAVAGCWPLSDIVMRNAGAVAGLLTLGGILFKSGYDASDRQNIQDAQKLLESVEIIKNL